MDSLASQGMTELGGVVSGKIPSPGGLGERQTRVGAETGLGDGAETGLGGRA